MTSPRYIHDLAVCERIALLAPLQAPFPSMQFVAGHENPDREMEQAMNEPTLQVPRKRDPGPLFPWARIMETVLREQPNP